jgi:predicted amidohydrolase
MKISLIQINSTKDIERNLNHAFKLIKEASAFNPDIIALPECFAYMIREGVRPEVNPNLFNQVLDEISSLAKKYQSYILTGTLPEPVDNEDKYYNSSVLINREGDIQAKYRKIHLFDIIQENKVLQESKFMKAGNEVVTTEIDGHVFGFSICYDLRFPELFRKMIAKNVEAVFIPSAFTMRTGKDHWQPLIRARAIENLMFIIAPAQTGWHDETRESYGHSMIVDPWGTVICQKGNGEGIINADVDMDYVNEVRNKIPSLNNRFFK